MELLCQIREVYKAIAQFENEMIKAHGLSLNEGMLLCTISKNDQLLSSAIAEQLGLTCSNTSKVIKSVEKKGLIHRSLGDEDKRQMLFSLTSAGSNKLQEMKSCSCDVPQELKRLFQNS
jgi:DNA-binding MarR family transcriptional regulator